MMHDDILITTFSTWMPHHTSNASDDLLQRLIERKERSFHHLRQVPVHFELSHQHVIERFNQLQPKVLICCGMAEERTKLNVESSAVLNKNTLKTKVDLERLVVGLSMTEISHDAGKFVCNTLYYKALEHLHAQRNKHQCIFVHVPVLTIDNTQELEKDFSSIIDRLCKMI